MTLHQRIELARCSVDAHALRLRRATLSASGGSGVAPGSYASGALVVARNEALDALERLGRLLAERERELTRVRCSACGSVTIRGAAAACASCGLQLPLPLVAG
jgi:hypothetical protein